MSAGRALGANATNNARGAGGARRRRWRPVRDAVWALLEDLLAEGGSVAVVGAGNGDDLPLRRLAGRAGVLDLIDLDADALGRAVARAGGGRGGGARAVVEDVTGGAADAIIAAALEGAGAGAEPPPLGDALPPLGAYDVVVADLVLTQLLYPALKAAGTLSGREIDAVLLRDGQPLTDAVVARLHASAPVVVILHDLLGWWKGHQQPLSLDALLRAAPDDARKLAKAGSVPYGCDPWVATRRAGARVLQERHWRWPFAPGADYLVFGLVTARRDRDPAARPPTAAPPGRPPRVPRPR
jgi:SAM-dependent methyltransferase